MGIVTWPLSGLRHIVASRRWRTAIALMAVGAFAFRARSVVSSAPRRSREAVQGLTSDVRVMFGRDEPPAREATAAAASAPAATAAGAPAPASAGATTAATRPEAAPAAPASTVDPTPSGGNRRIADSATNIPGDQPATEVAAPAETIAAGEDQSGTFRPARAETDEYGVIVTDDAPSGLKSSNWVKGDGSANCPEDHPIKGNANSRIFHQPGESSYNQTIPELCFATAEDALAAGFRPRAR
jgi:hypothetical protein